MVNTLPSDSMPETAANILLAVWKLGGIGKNFIPQENIEEILRENTPTDAVKHGLEDLRVMGFLESTDTGGRNAFSITPLGVAILRQIEEDKLEEIK